MTPATLSLLVVLLVCVQVQVSFEYKFQLGLKWGEKCKNPATTDYLKPSEECEMSKGLHCQQYQQGFLCGCLIKSSLSYDEYSGECRRKPGHHCPYINATESPHAYDQLSYNHKCHKRAECVLVDPIPEMGILTTKKSSASPSTRKEQFAVCKCRPGFKESRDMLVCHSVNGSPQGPLPHPHHSHLLQLVSVLLVSLFRHKVQCVL